MQALSIRKCCSTRCIPASFGIKLKSVVREGFFFCNRHAQLLNISLCCSVLEGVAQFVHVYLCACMCTRSKEKLLWRRGVKHQLQAQTLIGLVGISNVEAGVSQMILTWSHTFCLQQFSFSLFPLFGMQINKLHHHHHQKKIRLCPFTTTVSVLVVSWMFRCVRCISFKKTAWRENTPSFWRVCVFPLYLFLSCLHIVLFAC